MYILLLVIVLLAALLEILSVRDRSDNIYVKVVLSKLQAEPGETIAVKITVKNNGNLPASFIRVYADFPEDVSCRGDLRTEVRKDRLCVPVVFRLRGHQEKTETLEFSSSRRGLQSVSVDDVQTGDFLGIRTSKIHPYIRRQFLVYPEASDSDELPDVSGSFYGEMSARRWLLRDPVLTAGIRDYTGFEPMKTISWSQTARRGDLMVREFDFTRSINCCVILCTNGMEYDDDALLDTCCSAVRTICEELCENGVETDFFTNASLAGSGSPALRHFRAAPGKMTDVLEALARVSFGHAGSPVSIANTCLRSGTEISTYILAAPRRTAGIEEAAGLLSQQTGLSALLIIGEELEAAE